MDPHIYQVGEGQECVIDYCSFHLPINAVLLGKACTATALAEHINGHISPYSSANSCMTSSTKSHHHQMPISLDFMKRSMFIDLSLQLSTLPVISVALVGCNVSESELFSLGMMALAEMTVYLW